MFRAVLDPGVLIAALLSPAGAPAQLLRRWIDGEFELIVSPKLLNELGAVLLRPKFTSYVTQDETRAFLSLLEQMATVAADPPSVPGSSPDPGDDYLVALAGAAAAQYLVSGDAHLTGLRRQEPPVVTPRRFLSLLETDQKPKT
ncbi:MAG TPA: putative toxin-antitoxin system toxin component, PIN family [bacterium]|nr:putative toxin-antitoxin system toxin component, PIN family [bacterium]